MLDIREFSVSESFSKVADLARAHWLETEAGIGDGPAPLLGVYAELEKVSSIVAYGAFDDDQMVGYSVAILGPHLHYGFIYAHHDLLYISPEHRKGTLALRLIRMTEERCQALGAKFIAWHVKPDSTLEAILSRTGYAVEEVIYKKEF